MSQITHPQMQLSAQLRAHRIAALGALFALLAAAAVVLVLAIGDGPSTTSSVGEQPGPAVRADGGPEETSVAAAVASRGPTPSPLTVARYDGGPDESAVASAVGSQPTPVRPDESAVASAIGSGAEPASGSETPSGPGFRTD